ncbi:hypothetical protein Bwad005_12920 [Bilophila wadsworthia]
MQIEQPLPCVGFRQIAENAKLTRKSQILLGEPNNGTHSRVPFQNRSKRLTSNDRERPPARAVPVFENSSGQGNIAEGAQADHNPFRRG